MLVRLSTHIFHDIFRVRPRTDVGPDPGRGGPHLRLPPRNGVRAREHARESTSGLAPQPPAPSPLPRPDCNRVNIDRAATEHSPESSGERDGRATRANAMARTRTEHRRVTAWSVPRAV